jgi:hypothetical protein
MQIEISMKFISFLILCWLIISACFKTYQSKQDYFQITHDDLENKIQGGLLGQIIGNLNGLQHEFKYFNEPCKFETIFGKEIGEWVCRVDLKPGRYNYLYYSFQEVK